MMLSVAIAGGLGSVCRFLFDAVVSRHVSVTRERASLVPSFRESAFPLGTTLINILGSFILGLITGVWMTYGADPTVRAVLGTGFCGGFTTFSTASVETARLARGERNSVALVHSVGMLVASVGAAWVGILLGSA